MSEPSPELESVADLNVPKGEDLGIPCLKFLSSNSYPKLKQGNYWYLMAFNASCFVPFWHLIFKNIISSSHIPNSIIIQFWFPVVLEFWCTFWLALPVSKSLVSDVCFRIFYAWDICSFLKKQNPALSLEASQEEMENNMFLVWKLCNWWCSRTLARVEMDDLPR